MLIFQEPMSYVDTLMLKVPPYQKVSRIMVTCIFVTSGTVIAIFMHRKKTAEEEKLRLERQLQQAYKMESLGTLAGGIAHDFNNILYGTMGYAELCLDDLEKGSLLHNNLQEVIFGLERAKSLVRQILAFSRQSNPEIEPTAVAPLVKEVVNLLKATIPATIEIKVDADVPRSTIMGDPTQIHQVIMNLCANASQAMEEEGGVLRIGLKNVEVGAIGDGRGEDEFPPGSYLKLSVADTGVGIPPDHLNRIFDPFFTSKEDGKGTGMGLAVVHGIVESHHGRILVESFEGRGTTFEVYLPVIDGDENLEDQSIGKRIPEGDEHILLVDDRLEVLNMQKQLLERLGYTVSAKNSSLEALEALASVENKYDAVITDMTMPKMTGDRLTAKIKKIKPDLPVILCTGYSEKISSAKAKKIGLDALLLKPVGNMALAQTLRRVLDR